MTKTKADKYEVKDVSLNQSIGKYASLDRARREAQTWNSYAGHYGNVRVIRLSDNQIVDKYEDA